MTCSASGMGVRYAPERGLEKAPSRRDVGESREQRRQAENYKALLEKIDEARRLGVKVTLTGADQISLYVNHDQRKRRDIFNYRITRIPVYKRGGKLYLDVDVYDRWLDCKTYCAIHGLDFATESVRWGFKRPDLPSTSAHPSNKPRQKLDSS